MFPVNIQAWTDDKLKWDPSKYGNLQHIHVGNHEVWQPDILLYHRYVRHYTSVIDKKKCLQKLHKLFGVYFFCLAELRVRSNIMATRPASYTMTVEFYGYRQHNLSDFVIWIFIYGLSIRRFVI